MLCPAFVREQYPPSLLQDDCVRSSYKYHESLTDMRWRKAHGHAHRLRAERCHAGIRSEEFRHLISDIVIEPEYADGLMDIEENEFLTIVFYFDRNDGEYRLRLIRRGDPSRPITVSSTREASSRPAPLTSR